VGAVLHAARVSLDTGRGGDLESGGSLPRRSVAPSAAPESASTCRRPTWRATSTCSARRSATRH
jgi:hypothetical protein